MVSRSLHNIRMERAWRDVRKDCLETYRRIFIYLTNAGLLNMEVRIHRVALFLVFARRIQRNLDEMLQAWNNHKLRGEGNKSPNVLYELSRVKAI